MAKKTSYSVPWRNYFFSSNSKKVSVIPTQKVPPRKHRLSFLWKWQNLSASFTSTVKSQLWHKQQALDSHWFASSVNWKPGNWEQWESDLLAIDNQSFLLPKPDLGLCKASTANFSMARGRSQLAHWVSGSSLHQKPTSLTEGAGDSVFSTGSLYLRNDWWLARYQAVIEDKYLHLLPLHQRKSCWQGARQLGTAVF